MTAPTGSQKLGLATIVGLCHPLEEVLDVAAALGLDGIEITGRSPHLRPGASARTVAEVRHAAQARDLEVLAFGSYVGFRGAFERSDADTAVAIARDLGATRLRVWAESPSGRLDDRGFSAAVSLLKHCCDEAAVHRVEVVVERHRQSFADSAPNVERLLHAVGRKNLSLNYQPLDHLPADAAATVPADARRLAPLASYAHLKNYEVRNSQSRTLELGSSLAAGALDYRAILKASVDAGFEGPLVLEFTSDEESTPFEHRVRRDIDFLRELL